MKTNRNRFPDPAPLPEPEAKPAHPQPTRRRHYLRLVLSIAACLALLIVVCAAGLAALVNADGVHRYLIGLAERKASEELGVRVQLENFTLHLSTLSLDLYGLSVDGAPPYQGPRLLTVDHVAVGVRVVSVFGRKWYLRNVTVDHPVAWVFIDKNGASNLPTIKSSGAKSNITVWSLGIRHAVLNRGEVYFNSRPSALNADLHDLDFAASFSSLRTRYSGSLNYADGRIEYGAFRPFAHSLALRFEATPQQFRLTQARLESGPAKLNLSGTLDNYSHPLVRAHYDTIVDGTQMGAWLRNDSIPAGLVHADGDLQYQQVEGGSLIDAVTVNGRAASRRLEMRIERKNGAQRAEVDNLSLEYSLAGGNATLRNLRAQAFGGELAAAGQMKNVGGASHSTVSASLHGISLEQLQRTLLRSSLQSGVGISGTLNATAAAAWGKTISDLTARADATLHGEAAKTGGASAQGAANRPAVMPVESAIHAIYIGSAHRLELDSSYLRTSQTALTLNGTVGEHSSLQVQLQANDLREVSEWALLFSRPAPGKPVQPVDLAGKAAFAGTVTGSTDSPHLTGELTAQNLAVNGASVKLLRAGIDLSPNHAGLSNAELDAAPRGRITLNGGAGLEHWSFSNRSPVQLQLNATGLDIAELMKIAGREEPASGTLNVKLALHGSELNPEGSGSLTVTKAVVEEQPIREIKVNFSGNGEQARADLHVDMPAGSVEGNATVEPQKKAYSAELSSAGIVLEKLEAVAARNVPATGTLVFQVHGQGTFDNPEADANLEVRKLVVSNQPVSGLKLQAHLANGVADANLASSALGAEIEAKARVELRNNDETDASLDTKAFPLAGVLAAFAPDEASQLSGETEIHATVHGPLKNASQVEAHVTIPVLKLGYSNTIQFAATAPIQMDLKSGVLNLQPVSIRGTDTDLNLQAAVPLRGSGPMALVARGTVNLALVQLFDSDVRSSGEVKLNIDSHGPVRSGNLGGQVEIANANFASADLPVGLENANGLLTLTSDRINVEKFEGTIGGGEVTAKGGVAYRPNVEFNLSAAARDIRILYPQGMRESVDADIHLAGTPTKAVLGGSVDLADLSFTRAFDLTSFVHQFSAGVEAPQAQGFAQNLALNLSVRSTNSVNLVSRTVSVGGSANLQVRGTAANPVVLGRVNLSGGDIILNGNQFNLTGGTIQFVNPSETQPVVNLTVSTTIQEYNIQMVFNGPVDQMRTEYSSNPALPQADIINLLAFGETTEAAANSTATANQTAESLVASQVSSAVTSRISKVAGISQLSISPVLAGSSEQGPAGAVITIRQRVTGNLFVTLSTNVATTQDQTIQGQYQVSPRVTVSATRDPNGGFGVDALIKKSW